MDENPQLAGIEARVRADQERPAAAAATPVLKKPWREKLGINLFLVALLGPTVVIVLAVVVPAQPVTAGAGASVAGST